MVNYLVSFGRFCGKLLDNCRLFIAVDQNMGDWRPIIHMYVYKNKVFIGIRHKTLGDNVKQTQVHPHGNGCNMHISCLYKLDLYQTYKFVKILRRYLYVVHYIFYVFMRKLYEKHMHIILFVCWKFSYTLSTTQKNILIKCRLCEFSLYIYIPIYTLWYIYIQWYIYFAKAYFIFFPHFSIPYIGIVYIIYIYIIYIATLLVYIKFYYDNSIISICHIFDDKNTLKLTYDSIQYSQECSYTENIFTKKKTDV